MEIKKAVAAEEMKPATFINLVHIALDTYDDIFSDFDPSPYSSRLFSDDFLKEVQKRYSENKKGNFEVRFSLPAALRSVKTETLIKKRLKDYFAMQRKSIDYELERQRRKGGMYLVTGFFILTVTIFLASYNHNSDLILKLPEILLVPLGWYMTWMGIEKILETPSKLEDQKRFYEKFEKANYQFISEEEIVEQIGATAAKEEVKAEEKPKEEPKKEEKKPETEKGKTEEKQGLLK